MDKISVVIQTLNEETNIEGCVESAKLLTRNIILVDSGSCDQTVKLAQKYRLQIYHFPNCQYVEPARQFAIEKARTEWVLILDADERITFSLAQEINNIIKNTSYSHFKIARKNIFGRSKWLKNGGWWPDYQIRLINKQCFKSWPKEIHSTPVINGKIGYLDKPFIHYFHGDFEKMIDKTVIFEKIEANLLFQAGRDASTLIFFRKFIGELWRRLVINLGFLDGEIGIMESIYQAFSKTITYLYLYENKKSGCL